MNDLSARQCQYRLERLTPDIKASYLQASNSAVQAVQYALVCGRKLNEAKELCRHGEFGRYMVETCGIHPSTANRYMKLAENWTHIEEQIGTDKAALLTITEGLKYLKGPQSDHLKAGKSRSMRDFPPSEEIDDEPIEGTAAEVREVGGGGDAAGDPVGAEETELFEGPGGPSGAGDQRLDAKEGEVEPLFDAIDTYIDRIQHNADYIHSHHPNAQLWAAIGKHLDGIEEAVSKWRKT